jgi:hypothetical protein
MAENAGSGFSEEGLKGAADRMKPLFIESAGCLGTVQIGSGHDDDVVDGEI